MNKKWVAYIILIILVVVLAGALGYVTLVKKPAPVEQLQTNNAQNIQPIPEQNNIQTSSNVIQCGSVSQKILTQYDYQPTSSEKEAAIKSLACINQAIIKCSPASMAISKDNEKMNITVEGQGKSGCNVSVQKFTGEIMTCPLPSDYVANMQRKFVVSNYDGTIVTDLVRDINVEISSGNKSGSCTVTNLEQQITTIKNNQTPVQPTPKNQQVQPTNTKSFTISEVGVKVNFPNTYSLEKNNESNRRGSFVSYDFQQPGNYQTPYLYELQFFSEESIRNFTKGCEDTMCFEGDYPDLTRYSGQKTAFAQGKDYQNFKLQKIGARNWFVSSHRCVGDSCVIREYTTFLGNTKLDAWILMADSNEEQKADLLFTQFKIE